MTDSEEIRPTEVTVDAEKRTNAANIAEVKTIQDHTRERLLVSWHDDSDPSDPLNWSALRKWTITLVASIGGFITLMVSTMLAPALPQIAEDLNISKEEANMALSIFVLAFAVGPMLLAPMAEVFGRRPVWLVCSLWFAVWNMAGGFAHGFGVMLVARLMAGFGGSADYAIVQPLLGDLWRPEQRGMSFAIATFLPLLGPAIGPILSGVITGSIGWRWIFFIMSIFHAVLIIAGFFLLPETYRSLLLHRKALRLSKETGEAYYTANDAHRQPLTAKLATGLLRPGRMMLFQPIIQLMSLLLAFSFGTLYFVLTSYAALWTEHYDETVSISGLHYIALAIGYTVAAQGGARLTDMLWKRQKAKHEGEAAPEFRIPLMVPGSILIPTGLLIYGWSGQVHAPWPAVDLGGAIFGCGTILSTQAMQQYVMECFPEHVSSAVAASQFLRSIFAFCFPLFAPQLYEELGYGWGNTTLASVFCVLTGLATAFLWLYGARLRARGDVVK